MSETANEPNTELEELGDVQVIQNKFMDNLTLDLRSCMPALVADVHDRRQFIADVYATAKGLPGEAMKVLHWDSAGGLMWMHPHGSSTHKLINATSNPAELMMFIRGLLEQTAQYPEDIDGLPDPSTFGQRTIVLIRNIDCFWAAEGVTVHQTRQYVLRDMILNIMHLCRKQRVCLLFYGPDMRIPKELRDDVKRIRYTLPGVEALEARLDHIVSGVRLHRQDVAPPTPENKAKILNAVRGLTINKADLAISKGVVQSGFNLNQPRLADKIAEVRRQSIRELGLVEIVTPTGGFSDTIGGYGHVRQMIQRDRAAMLPEAWKSGVDKPAGFLLGSSAGCGKSSIVKAVGYETGMDVLWIRADRILDSKLGESERRLGQILDIPANNYQGCGVILWFDEADKLFGSFGGGPNTRDDSTSGTGMRMLQILLTYLQERNNNPDDMAYIMATFNNGWFLPDAIVRPGRFNSRVWLSLPTEEEREHIFKVHLKQRKQDPEKFDTAYYAKFTERFSGAEIEYTVSEATKQVFFEQYAEFLDGIEIDAEGLKKFINEHGSELDRDAVHKEIQAQIHQCHPNARKTDSEYHEQTRWANESGYLQSSFQQGGSAPITEVESEDSTTSGLGNEGTSFPSVEMVKDLDDD